METLMENLVNKDFALVEDTVDVVAYSKDLHSGDNETVTFMMDTQEILHERYNKNGVQTYSQKMNGANRSQIALLIATIK